MSTETLHEQAVEDERRESARLRRLEKARRVRDGKRSAEIWQQVKQAKRDRRCTCELHRGMTQAELIELGSGCTAGRWVCPVLDKYRRLVGGQR